MVKGRPRKTQARRRRKEGRKRLSIRDGTLQHRIEEVYEEGEDNRDGRRERGRREKGRETSHEREKAKKKTRWRGGRVRREDDRRIGGLQECSC